MYPSGFLFLYGRNWDRSWEKSQQHCWAHNVFCSCSLACLDKFMAISFFPTTSLDKVNACLNSVFLCVFFSSSGFAQVWQVTEIPPQHLVVFSFDRGQAHSDSTHKYFITRRLTLNTHMHSTRRDKLRTVPFFPPDLILCSFSSSLACDT